MDGDHGNDPFESIHFVCVVVARFSSFVGSYITRQLHNVHVSILHPQNYAACD